MLSLLPTMGCLEKAQRALFCTILLTPGRLVLVQ